MDTTFGVIWLTALWLSSSAAQALDATDTALTSDRASDKEVLTRLTALRDMFINTIEARGFHVRLNAPTIVLDNPPSYGNYDDDKNVLHIAVWRALSEQQRNRFEHVSQLLNDGRSGEQTFEDSAHRWIFVHELGHWWQASQRKISSNHYSVEYGANRIAAAFWREKDPNLMRRTEDRMTRIKPSIQNPLPDGQRPEAFFNENYESLGPTPGYIWFQYSMVLSVQAERPLPTFKQTLARPVFP